MPRVTRAGDDVHLRAHVVGRRHEGDRRRLGIERPFQRAQAAAAEFLVDRRALRHAVGHLGHDDVDVEALATGQLSQGVGVGRELRRVLGEEARVDGLEGAAAAAGLALQRRHRQLLLQHADADDREVGGIVTGRLVDVPRDRRGRLLIVRRGRLLGGRRCPGALRADNRRAPGRLPPEPPPA